MFLGVLMEKEHQTDLYSKVNLLEKKLKETRSNADVQKVKSLQEDMNEKEYKRA